MSEAELFTSIDDLEGATGAWQLIVHKLGAERAQLLFEDLEAYHGPIRFRQVALDLIAAATAAGPHESDRDEPDSETAPHSTGAEMHRD